MTVRDVARDDDDVQMFAQGDWLRAAPARRARRARGWARFEAAVTAVVVVAAVVLLLVVAVLLVRGA